jgi:sulfate adenylyltransferase subunit 2
MTTTAPLVRLSHLDALESEAIHIMREVAAELERPVLLFSGGKDSIVLPGSRRRRSAPAASRSH